MKVLYVVHASSIEEYSGTPLIAHQYAEEGLKKGCEVCIITPTFDNFNFENQQKQNVNNINFLKWPGLKNWGLEAFRDKNLNTNKSIAKSFLKNFPFFHL